MKRTTVRALLVGLGGGILGAALVVVLIVAYVLSPAGRARLAAVSVTPTTRAYPTAVSGPGPQSTFPAPDATVVLQPTTNPTVLSGYYAQQSTQAAHAAATRTVACEKLRHFYEERGVAYRPQATAELTLFELRQLYGVTDEPKSFYAQYLVGQLQDAVYLCLGP
jgi:hypothetical protein